MTRSRLVALVLAGLGVCAACRWRLAGPEPWTSLFDGISTRGWTTVGGPYDGDARWTVEEGAIVGRPGPQGAGGLLYTERTYRNFELALEVNIEPPFDSGIFVRMRPGERGMQLTLDHRPDGEIGGLYSDGWILHLPGGAERFRSGEWNRIELRCTGDPLHVVARLDGSPLVDYRVPDELGPFAASGRIGLQVHDVGSGGGTGIVRFRELFVRELPDDLEPFRRRPDGRRELTDHGRAAGWRALFGDAGLAGWEPVGGTRGFRVEDGVLALLVDGDADYLRTEDDFRDFQLRLDFRIAPLANSGLFLRGDRAGGDPAYSGCEIQIVDHFDWERATGDALKPWQYTGSLYAAQPPSVPDAMRPIGAWNTYDVLFRGSRLVVVLNGHVLYDVDTLELDADPPFAERVPAGFLGLQRHAPAGVVEGEAFAWFRDAFVREL